MHTLPAISAAALTLATLTHANPEPIGPAAGAIIAGVLGGVGAAGAGALTGGLGLLGGNKLKAKRHHTSTSNPNTKRRESKRQESVNHSFQILCQEELGSATVRVSQPSEHDVRFEGMPPDCMRLAESFSGDESNTRPEVVGPDAIEFTGLTDEEFGWIAQALEAVPQAAKQ